MHVSALVGSDRLKGLDPEPGNSDMLWNSYMVFKNSDLNVYLKESA